MPRKKRSELKPRFNNNNIDDNSMDGVLDGDLEECGSPHGHHPLQRNAANARERARMRVLSRAFCRLKTTLPWVPADTKLSKLDTLRLATSYIAHLREVLLLPAGEMPPTPHNPSSPPNLTWPFTLFSQPGQPEPWISRTASTSSRVPRVPGNPANPPSGSSSNASSSADDDVLVLDEDGNHDDDPRLPDTCRRLSGGRLLDQGYQQPVPHCHPYLQRYVDA